MKEIYFSMRGIAFSTAVLMSVSAMALSADAAGKLSVSSVDPADGSTVESLKRINLELENVTEVGVEWKSGLQAPVTDAEGNEVTYVKGRDYGNVFALSLATEITEPGTYTVSVPAGAFYTPDWDSSEWPLPAVAGSENDAFTLTYTIGSASSDNKLTVISADPADGSTVESLKRINLELANVTEVGVEWKSGLQAPVTDAEGNEVTYVKGRDYGNVFALSLATEITEPGTYTVSVPAGAFYTPDWNSSEWPLPAVAGSENEAFTLTYTVSNAQSGVSAVNQDENGIIANNGMVVANGFNNPEIIVYTLSGVEAARGNGSVCVAVPGIYIVKVADADSAIVKRISVK